MFVYSVRSSSIKFFSVVIVCLLILSAVITLSGGNYVYAMANGIEVNFDGVKDNEKRIEFIKQFGLLPSEEFTEESIVLPTTLDRVLGEYNQMQKKQGLDLTKYLGKRVTRFTYKIENYNYDGAVYVNLIIYRDRIIGCDLASLDGSGFVIPLCDIDVKNVKK